jgi:cytochrome c-type biogenesis protein CcmE
MLVAIGFAYWELRGYHSFGETLLVSAAAVLAGTGVSLLYMRQRVVAIAIAAAAVIVGVVLPFAHGMNRLSGGGRQYREVEDVMADPDRFAGDELRLHGQVELGSVKTQVVDQQTMHTFTIAKHDRRVAARITGPVPDTFQDRAEVVATGRLVKRDNAYVFEATEVIAKCPSTYNTKDGPQPASKFR